MLKSVKLRTVSRTFCNKNCDYKAGYDASRTHCDTSAVPNWKRFHKSTQSFNFQEATYEQLKTVAWIGTGQVS